MNSAIIGACRSSRAELQRAPHDKRQPVTRNYCQKIRITVMAAAMAVKMIFTTHQGKCVTVGSGSRGKSCRSTLIKLRSPPLVSRLIISNHLPRSVTSSHAAHIMMVVMKPPFFNKTMNTFSMPHWNKPDFHSPFASRVDDGLDVRYDSDCKNHGTRKHQWLSKPTGSSG